MTPRSLVLYCGLLFSLSAFSVDIMLPVLDDISTQLVAQDTLVKMTVTIYLFAFGIGQILFGPSADRFGRRPTIITGLIIFLCGAAVSVVAQDISALLAGRFLQGLGGAAGHVIGRAIIRDCYQGKELARNLALAMAVFSAGPLVAPLLGYGLGELVGWRGVFGGMGLFGLGLLIVGIVNLPETLANPNPRALQPNVLAFSAKQFFSCRQTLYFWLLGGSAAIGMHYFLANAASLYKDHLGVTNLVFALLFASHGIGIILGQIASRRLITKFGIAAAVRVATGMVVLALALTLAFAAADMLNAAGFATGMFVFAVWHLVIIANCAALAIDNHGNIAGFASSAIGFGTMSFGAAGASALTLALGNATVAVWTAAMLCICTINFVASVSWRKKAAA